MPDVDVRRVQRYLITIRENTEDIRGLITRYEDDQILKDRYLLKALKYCLIEIAEAMADTLQHLLSRTKGLAAESYLELVEKASQSALIDPDLLGRLKFFFKSATCWCIAIGRSRIEGCSKRLGKASRILSFSWVRSRLHWQALQRLRFDTTLVR